VLKYKQMSAWKSLDNDPIFLVGKIIRLT